MDNDDIERSIAVRKRAIYDYYNLPPEALEQAETVFKRMEEMAQKSVNQDSFEQEYAISTLNDEYNDLFQKFEPYNRHKKTQSMPSKSINFSNLRSILGNQQNPKTTIKQIIFKLLPDNWTHWIK